MSELNTNDGRRVLEGHIRTPTELDNVQNVPSSVRCSNLHTGEIGKDSRSSGIISIGDRCWGTMPIPLRPSGNWLRIHQKHQIKSIQFNSKLFSHSQPSGNPAAKPHRDMTANSGYLTGAICISFMVFQSCWQMSSQLRGLERLSKQCDCSNCKLQWNRQKPTSHMWWV